MAYTDDVSESNPRVSKALLRPGHLPPFLHHPQPPISPKHLGSGKMPDLLALLWGSQDGTQKNPTMKYTWT